MKLSLGAKIGLAIGLLGGLIGIAVAIISAPVPGLIFSIVIIAIFFFVFWGVFRPMIVQKKLLKTGVSARAVIKQVSDTGVTVNNNPQIKLLLEVTPPAGAPYLVETKMIISRLQPGMYQPGTELAVKVDPNDKDKVAVDPTGGAAGGGFSGASMTQQEAEAMLIKINDENTRLMAYGESARAIVTGYQWMGIYVNGNNPFVTLDLEVLPETRKSFKAKAKGVIAEQSVPKYQPGEEIYVKFDPNDTSKVTIEHS